MDFYMEKIDFDDQVIVFGRLNNKIVSRKYNNIIFVLGKKYLLN